MSFAWQPSAVLFGDVELAVITRLQDTLTDVGVYDTVPKANSSLMPYVTVNRLGGTRSSIVSEDATIGIEAWATSWESALATCQAARFAVHGMPGQSFAGVGIVRVREFAGPARLPDPNSDNKRFVMTFSITARNT